VEALPATVELQADGDDSVHVVGEISPAEDAVNPQHYKGLGRYSAVHVIRRWSAHRRSLGLEPIGFDVGNALKYIQRAGTKTGEDEVTDLKKSVWYLLSRIHELDPSEPDPAGDQ
jgi:hypothetical protein